MEKLQESTEDLVVMLTPTEDLTITLNKVDTKVDQVIKELEENEVDLDLTLLQVMEKDLLTNLMEEEITDLAEKEEEILEILEVEKKDTLHLEILILLEDEMKEMTTEVVLVEEEKSIDLLVIVVIPEILENMVLLEEKEVDLLNEEEEKVDHLLEVEKLRKKLLLNGKKQKMDL